MTIKIDDMKVCLNNYKYIERYGRLVRIRHPGENTIYYNVDFIKSIEIEPVMIDGQQYYQFKLYCKDSEPQYSYEIFKMYGAAENKLKGIMYPEYGLHTDLNKIATKIGCYDDE